MDQTFQVKL